MKKKYLFIFITLHLIGENYLKFNPFKIHIQSFGLEFHVVAAFEIKIFFEDVIFNKKLVTT